MNENRFIDTIRRAIKARISINQIAELHEVSPNTIRNIIRREDPSLASDLKLNQTEMLRERGRAKRMAQMQAAEERAAKAAERARRRQLRRLKDDLEGVTDKDIRFEMTYATALIMFERKNAQEKRRPKLPCDFRAPKPDLVRKSVKHSHNSVKPLRVGGIHFRSRTEAAEMLGISRGRLTTLLSKDATARQKERLVELLDGYKEAVKEAQATP